MKTLIPNLTLIVSSLLTSVYANTEKTIFLGPETIRVPAQHPTLEDLHLDVLTPSENSWSLRTSLSREFPNSTHPDGPATWLLLDDLTKDQRYEVRVCWAATQPTAFKITTYPLETVFSTPDLISSLNQYSLSRLLDQASSSPQGTPKRAAALNLKEKKERDRESSLLLLQISSAADYFTTNATLMKTPPPVDVDIILDPFLLNVLPRSLVPTVLYIILVAAVACFLSGKVLSFLDTTVLGLTKATTSSREKKKTN